MDRTVWNYNFNLFKMVSINGFFTVWMDDFSWFGLVGFLKVSNFVCWFFIGIG